MIHSNSKEYVVKKKIFHEICLFPSFMEANAENHFNILYFFSAMSHNCYIVLLSCFFFQCVKCYNSKVSFGFLSEYTDRKTLPLLCRYCFTLEFCRHIPGLVSFEQIQQLIIKIVSD